MILYCVTATLDQSIETEWLAWMRDHHIQDLLDTGHFTDAQIRRVLEPEAAPGKVTYCIEYHAPTLEALRTYQATDATALKQDHLDRFGDQMRASRTVYEVVPR